MGQITDIYKMHYANRSFGYRGTLRNEKTFKMHDRVYFAFLGCQIAFGVVCGIEIEAGENPSYIYKISISDWLLYAIADDELKSFMHSDKVGKIEKVTLKCDKIFKSVKEAKESALKNCRVHYKLELENINRYFGALEKSCQD